MFERANSTADSANAVVEDDFIAKLMKSGNLKDSEPGSDAELQARMIQKLRQQQDEIANLVAMNDVLAKKSQLTQAEVNELNQKIEELGETQKKHIETISRLEAETKDLASNIQQLLSDAEKQKAAAAAQINELKAELVRQREKNAFLSNESDLDTSQVFDAMQASTYGKQRRRVTLPAGFQRVDRPFDLEDAQHVETITINQPSSMPTLTEEQTAYLPTDASLASTMDSIHHDSSSIATNYTSTSMSPPYSPIETRGSITIQQQSDAPQTQPSTRSSNFVVYKDSRRYSVPVSKQKSLDYMMDNRGVTRSSSVIVPNSSEQSTSMNDESLGFLGRCPLIQFIKNKIASPTAATTDNTSKLKGSYYAQYPKNANNNEQQMQVAPSTSIHSMSSSVNYQMQSPVQMQLLPPPHFRVTDVDDAVRRLDEYLLDVKGDRDWSSLEESEYEDISCLTSELQQSIISLLKSDYKYTSLDSHPWEFMQAAADKQAKTMQDNWGQYHTIADAVSTVNEIFDRRGFQDEKDLKLTAFLSYSLNVQSLSTMIGSVFSETALVEKHFLKTAVVRQQLNMARLVSALSPMDKHLFEIDIELEASYRFFS